MVDSAKRPIPLTPESRSVCTMQAVRTKSLPRDQNFPFEWPATESPSLAQSKGVTNGFYRNNYRRNLNRGSTSGFAHLVPSHALSVASHSPSESTVRGKCWDSFLAQRHFNAERQIPNVIRSVSTEHAGYYIHSKRSATAEVKKGVSS